MLKPLFLLLYLTLLASPAVFAQKATLQFIDTSDIHLPEIVKKSLNSMDAQSIDIDGDGDLDRVLAMEFVKNVVLINDGKGKFSDGSSWLSYLGATITPKPYPYYPCGDTEVLMLPASHCPSTGPWACM